MTLLSKYDITLHKAQPQKIEEPRYEQIIRSSDQPFRISPTPENPTPSPKEAVRYRIPRRHKCIAKLKYGHACYKIFSPLPVHNGDVTVTTVSSDQLEDTNQRDPILSRNCPLDQSITNTKGHQSARGSQEALQCNKVSTHSQEPSNARISSRPFLFDFFFNFGPPEPPFINFSSIISLCSSCIFTVFVHFFFNNRG